MFKSNNQRSIGSAEVENPHLKRRTGDGMSVSLTVGERIVLHLSHYGKYMDAYEVPMDICQDGIARALGISRAHATLELKKLKSRNKVVEKRVHIKKGRTRRKVYFLSTSGENMAKYLYSFINERSSR